MKKLVEYKNGNYTVTLYEDGTKIRQNDLDSLIPEFPESMDMKISNYCPYNCPMCHEKSNDKGQFGNILNNKFIDKLHKGTELALGGGAITFHPDLVPFLEKLKDKGIYPSITINQREYTNPTFFKDLINNKLIYGLGVSFSDYDDKVWNELLEYKNTVVHLIAGYHNIDVFRYFMNKQAKILILGYKQWGRGNDFYNHNMKTIKKNIDDLKKLLPSLLKDCAVVSFDNLSIKQLNIRNYVSEEKWKEFYMGDDGQYTMYVDLVKNQCAKSSTSKNRYPLKDFDKLWQEIKIKE